MTATIYETRRVSVKPRTGPISVFIELNDMTSNETVMSFTSECRWKYFPGPTDSNRERTVGSDSLDDFEALIKLGDRPADHNVSRVDISVSSGSLVEKEHKYKVTFKIRQAGSKIDTWSTEEREFDGIDVFTVSYLFIH